jgi:hypothetical protein
MLLILPTALVFTAAVLNYARGPYWISYNSDPEYLYLLSSLSLAESKQVETTKNPGTTIQILGAATLKIAHALDFSEKNNLEFDVLKSPEFYLTVINVVLVTFNTLMLFIVGWTAFSLTKNIWLSLLLQLSPFLSITTLNYSLCHVSPEPFLLFSSLLFSLILVKMAFSKDLSKSAHWYMIALALVSGFGVATKFTFAPLLIIPLMILPKLRNKICFLVLTVLSFVLWTWPIISRYEILFDWCYGILTHVGYYGKGSSGIISPGVYFQNILFLLGIYPLFFLNGVFSAVVILMMGWSFAGGDKAARKTFRQDISFRILMAVTAAQLCAVLIIAKHPADRYLLPVLNLSGLMLFLIFIYLRRIDYFKRLNLKKAVLFAGIFFVLISVLRINDIKNMFIQKMQIKQEVLAVHRRMETGYKDYLKVYFVFISSSPISALAFGNYFIADGVYSEALQKIYGEANFYNLFNGKFQTWTREFSIEDVILKGQGSKVVFLCPPLVKYGDKIACSTGSILYLRDILRGQYETIYALDGIQIIWEKKFQPIQPSP